MTGHPAIRLLCLFGAGLAVAALPSLSSAAQVFKCSHDGKTDVTISLGAKEAFGQKLGCIEGPFVGAMTACAPKNGYGLSAASGEARLTGVTSDWRAGAHDPGPIAGVKVNPAKYLFEGGLLGADHTVKKTWTFEISRRNGQAVQTSAGKTSVRYQCAKASDPGL